jgi:MYXO-CTERM domain-containing protein
MTHAPVLGTARDVAFLFGGSGSAAVDDAWTWNGTRWSAVTAPAGPDARYGHVMFYDDSRSSAVVFGGARATLLLADIVGYDGTAWAPFTPAATPRMDAAMAFDSRRKTGVLFGGFRTLDTYAQGTWEWHSEDGTWAQRSTRVTPVARGDAAMTYDPRRERVVMFGGGAGSSYFETSETWEYGVLGGSCTSNAECDQYACVDGACCEVPGCGPCSRCSVVTGACEAVVNGDDQDSCTGSSTCDAKGACKKKDGALCTAKGDCVSDFCSDGVCCNRGCEGTCEACDTADAPGTCTLVRGDPRHGSCEGALPCGSTCTGEDANCQFVSAGVSCGSSCENARISERACDGAGTCTGGPSEACPNELRCADRAVCLTGCRVDADCTPGHACRDGACAVPEDFCEDEATLRRRDGTTESCEPYICRTGACLESCSIAAQCASGLVCDSKHRCIAPPEPRREPSDSGCGCHVPGKEPRRTDGALAVLGLMLAAALRRGGRRTTVGW